MTIDDAYREQHAAVRLRELRGESVAGYKIGCVSPVMQAQLGIDRPVFGHIFATELHASGVTLDFDRYDGLAVEGEIAVRVGGAAFVVIELHHYAIRETPLTAAELIASNCIHAGVVLPAEEPPLRDPRVLLDEPVSVYKNEVLLGTASGSALPDGPEGSVARLAEHLRQFGRQLRPGQIVLTGSPLPLYRVEKGDRIDVVSERLGRRTWAAIT